jgi:hypothetical protein
MRSRKAGAPVKLSVFVSPDENAAIVQEAKIRRDIAKQDWIAEAIRAHLKNAGFKSAEVQGPLASLSPRDQRRVLRYAELLRVSDDEVFRTAIDSCCDLFARPSSAK